MKTLLSFLLLVLSCLVGAMETTITNVDLVLEKPTENRLAIKTTGNINENPQMTVGKNSIDLFIPKSRVNAKIIKKIRGATITATQADRESVNVKIVLPYSLEGKEALTNVALNENAINVFIPRLVNAATDPIKLAPKNARQVGVNETINKAIAEASTDKEAEKLDENYLSELVKENEKLAAKQHPEKNELAPKKGGQVDTGIAADRVNVTQASVEKTAPNTKLSSVEPSKSNFSISTYIGKFIAFLSLMVLGFYGVLTMMKKGVIKKGKLGFLHSTKLVEVISTTHVAPKRSLMMVKAHKQVFLVSNTETGIQLISEIQDVAGLIKSGEEEVTGSNFDTNLISANRSEKQFKLKEDTVAEGYSTLDDMLSDDLGLDDERELTPVTSAAKAIEKAPVKDQVRFSDQIKTKLKNMKQIQY